MTTASSNSSNAICFNLFFSHHRNRPVLMAEGPGGSGKGSLGEAIGYLLIGPKFHVTNAPSTAEQLAELMTGVPYVVFDEWDKIDHRTENAFKQLVTGGRHKRRELYTTAKVIELACDAASFLATNANPMKQAGTSRRYIVLPIAPRQQAPGERVFRSASESLIKSFLAVRTEMWLDLIADLASCVCALAPTDPHTQTSFSLSDFGVFVQRVADYEGWGSDASKLFVDTERQQQEQAAKALTLGTLIPELLTTCPNLQGHFFMHQHGAKNFWPWW